ncbi:MAG: DegT/DnrJ/EryC1/StrS family aminotransferase [Chitinophagaceae bacterium]
MRSRRSKPQVTCAARSCPRIAATMRTCIICCCAISTQRTRFIATLKEVGIRPVFHYVPLHSAPAGRRYGRAAGDLAVTDTTSDRLVRLPLWLPDMDQARVIDAVEAFFR